MSADDHMAKLERLAAEDEAATPTCTIPDCARRPYRRGWCSSHYRRWRELGDPEAGAPIRQRFETPEESFASRLVQNGECIEWHGAMTNAGYGNMSIRGRFTPAHKYSWERINGPVPPGIQLDHVCHNRRCVRIDHLRLATNAENSRNRSGAQRRSRTGVRNVIFDKGAYQVVVGFNYRRIYGGRYPTLKEADMAARQKRHELFGAYRGPDGTADLTRKHEPPEPPQRRQDAP